MNSVEIADVVAAAINGDEKAWNTLVDQFGRLVWSVARSHRLDDATTADVVQEAWVRLAQNLHRLRDPSRVGSWLATTARNEALRLQKKQRREVPDRFDNEAVLGHSLPADTEVLAGEQHDLLVQSLDQISEPCQLLLRLLVETPRVSYDEIAEIMDMAVGSIGPTRARCLAKLRERLEQVGAI